MSNTNRYITSGSRAAKSPNSDSGRHGTAPIFPGAACSAGVLSIEERWLVFESSSSSSLLSSPSLCRCCSRSNLFQSSQSRAEQRPERGATASTTRTDGRSGRLLCCPQHPSRPPDAAAATANATEPLMVGSAISGRERRAGGPRQRRRCRRRRRRRRQHRRRQRRRRQA